MDRKILVGSIIAVAILIGVSFTSVVGYQSVKPDVKASPLFTVRTKRANDKESNSLTCDYVGKGKKSPIQLPKREDINELLQKAIITLSKMNDKEFNKFLTMMLYYLFEKNSRFSPLIHFLF